VLLQASGQYKWLWFLVYLKGPFCQAHGLRAAVECREAHLIIYVVIVGYILVGAPKAIEIVSLARKKRRRSSYIFELRLSFSVYIEGAYATSLASRPSWRAIYSLIQYREHRHVHMFV